MIRKLIWKCNGFYWNISTKKSSNRPIHHCYNVNCKYCLQIALKKKYQEWLFGCFTSAGWSASSAVAGLLFSGFFYMCTILCILGNNGSFILLADFLICCCSCIDHLRGISCLFYASCVVHSRVNRAITKIAISILLALSLFFQFPSDKPKTRKNGVPYQARNIIILISLLYLCLKWIN